MLFKYFIGDYFLILFGDFDLDLDLLFFWLFLLLLYNDDTYIDLSANDFYGNWFNDNGENLEWDFERLFNVGWNFVLLL